MSDLEFLQQYIDSPPPGESKKSGFWNGGEELALAPGQSTALPYENGKPVKIGGLQVEPGPKVEEVLKEEKKKSSKSFMHSANIAKKKTDKVLGAAVPDLGDLPTPPTGGIGLLVFISLLMVFAITPLSGGGTRLSKLWGAVLGNATLPGDGPAGPGIQAPPGFSPSVPYIPGPLDVIQGVL